MASEKIAVRRRYSAEFKAQVVGECEVSGASVAKVAMAHGINANVVHGWRQLSRQAHETPTIRMSADARTPAAFMPVAIPAQPPVCADIHIEIKRGATAVSVSWPASAASDCATWLYEWLR